MAEPSRCSGVRRAAACLTHAQPHPPCTLAGVDLIDPTTAAEEGTVAAGALPPVQPAAHMGLLLAEGAVSEAGADQHTAAMTSEREDWMLRVQ